MKYYQKKTLFIVVILLICSIFPFIDEYKIFAESIEVSNEVDVVFVIDASKSMNKSDPSGLTSEAMKMFIDMCHIKGDKGGMVAYSGEVIKEYPLKYMNSQSDKSLLKDTLTGLQLGNWTDIGLGLRRAVSMLKDGHGNNSRPILILLSDGKNDPKHDKKASQDDLTAALNEAKTQQFPIYTIGLNADGTVDKNQLETISKETNGKNFITNNAVELPKILREIFADNSRLKILQDETINGNSQFQNVKINIPDSNTVEANISILSSKPVELRLKDAKEHDVKIPSEKVMYTTSKNYSILKLISPEKGDWLLSVKGSTGDKMDISLISNYDLKAGLKLSPENNFHKGDKVEIQAHVESNGLKLEDMEFLSMLKSNAYVKNLTSGEMKEIPMKLLGNIFTGEFVIQEDNKFDIKAKIEGPGFVRESEIKNISIDNIMPLVAKKIENMTLWNKKITEINLAAYLVDSDGDKLTYSVSSSDISPSDLKISGNTLIIQGGKWGSNTITIAADDGKGGKISTDLVVRIYPLIYLVFGAAAVMITILLITSIKYLFKRTIKANVGHMISRAGHEIIPRKYKKSELTDSYTEHNEAPTSKASILDKIDKSTTMYEREICEEIESLCDSDKSELFETLRISYIYTKEDFFKASYLTYNYENIKADNFNIIQVMRNSATDCTSMDNLIKYIISSKGLAGVIRYLNHLSKYREVYGLEDTYFESVLSILVNGYSLDKSSDFRKLNKELVKVVKNIKKDKIITQQSGSSEAF
jgi:Ca-activated chloride channel homolog